MAHLEGSIVPQRALGGRAQAKLRGQLPEAASDARELVGSRARPAQVVDWRSPTPCKSTNLTKRAPYAYKSDAKCGASSQVACFRILRTTRRTRSSRFRTACDGSAV